MSVTAKLRELQHASPRQLAESVQRSLPYGVSALLVIAIAWQLVQLTWLLLNPSDSASHSAASAPSVAPRAQPVDIQRIARADLFGRANAPAAGQSDVNAPQTQMNLRLAGTIASDDPSKGWAIIGESGGAGKFYATGATLPGGARLHAVYADRVILERDGQLEALTLPRLNPNLARAAPPPLAQNKFADNLRRIAESNPGVLAEVIRPQPVFAGGAQRGYRVYPGRNRQQFAQLGLRPGDLILAINGTPLDDPNRGAEIFSTLGSSGRVTVNIERNGQTQELTLNTAQIALPPADADSEPEEAVESRRPNAPASQ